MHLLSVYDALLFRFQLIIPAFLIKFVVQELFESIATANRRNSHGRQIVTSLFSKQLQVFILQTIISNRWNIKIIIRWWEWIFSLFDFEHPFIWIQKDYVVFLRNLFLCHLIFVTWYFAQTLRISAKIYSVFLETVWISFEKVYYIIRELCLPFYVLFFACFSLFRGYISRYAPLKNEKTF